MKGVSSVIERLNDPGWCLVRSAALDGEVVLWLRDERTAFPRSAAGHVVYLLEELDRLVDSGIDQETLRFVHRSKRVLAGVVTSVRPCANEGWGEAPPCESATASPGAVADARRQSPPTGGTNRSQTAPQRQVELDWGNA